MRSVEPGISRFRVWSCGPSRNDVLGGHIFDDRLPASSGQYQTSDQNAADGRGLGGGLRFFFRVWRANECGIFQDRMWPSHQVSLHFITALGSQKIELGL